MAEDDVHGGRFWKVVLLERDRMGTVLFYSKTMREEVAREMENGSRRADVGCTVDSAERRITDNNDVGVSLVVVDGFGAVQRAAVEGWG